MIEAEHRILLLTGYPGVGKTTVIRRIADSLSNKRLGGFYTEEIREGGVRKGFRLISFDSQEAVIAHVDFPKTYSVSKYGVDVTAIDQAVGPTLEIRPEIDVYLVDEIGKMECMSELFATAIRKLLDSDKTVIATVARRGTGLIAEVKRHPDAVLREVTPRNRDPLPAQLLRELRLPRGVVGS